MQIISISTTQIREFVLWRYPPPKDVYNMVEDPNNEAEIAEMVAYFADPAMQCHAVIDEEEGFIAFCTYGEDGRVDGGDYSKPAIDMGMGMRPDLVGKGNGRAVIAAITDYAQKTFNPPALRVTINVNNIPPQRIRESLGFQRQQEFTSPRNGKSFYIYYRENEMGN